MKKGFWIGIFYFLLAALPARAQFFSAGSDPAFLKWSQIRTANYRVIYPSGADSLARAYAMSLQEQYPRIGRSAGYAPSALCPRPMPVILHTFTPFANGMVMWAPRRMELYTVGDAADPDPTPWLLNLTTHEPRHAAQLQFGRRRPFGALRWLVGDLSDVAWWSIYTGIAFSEGDAVVAETGLTGFGRGRTADFLEYLRVAFDEGDWRDYYRWRYGSVKRYTPDHYRAGYLLAAGLRTGWDEPRFLERYQDNLFARKLPVPFFNLQYTIRQVTGLPTVKAAFGTISQDFRKVWEENDRFRVSDVAARLGVEDRGGPEGPDFIEGVPLTPLARRYTAFRGATACGDEIYAVETGLERTARLVRIAADGTVSYLRPFAPTASDLRIAGERLFWSEERRDPRWELAGTSVIRSMDPGTGKVVTLADPGRGSGSLSHDLRLYNPAPSEDGSRVAAMAYLWDGSHQVRILPLRPEERALTIPVPSGMQPVQGAWIDGRLFISAVTDEGFGIYDAFGDWRPVLPGRPVKIKQLRARDSRLWFVCDKSGVNELYSCDPASGDLRQHSLLRHGGQDFLWNAAGDTLYFTVLSTEGRRFHKAPASSFTAVRSDWDAIWKNPVAEELSAQERSLEAEEGIPDRLGRGAGELTVSEPRPYRKAGHLLRFHSWAPLYVDYDAVSSMSFSSLFEAVTLGATAFFQNDLSTATGSLGYSARPQASKDWKHLLDLRFNYTGWYPVVETSLQLSSNHPSRYQFTHLAPGSASGTADPRPDAGIVSAAPLRGPAVSFMTRIYVPLSFPGGGWSRGVIPQIRYSLSNNIYDGTVFSGARTGIFPDKDRTLVLTGMEPGASVFVQNVTASVRAYAMLPVAPAGVYPRWGIGAELGGGFRPALTHIYDPAAYAYLYGYLPGIVPEHGLKLTGIVQRYWSGDASRRGLAAGSSGNAGTEGGRPRAYLAEQRVVTYPRGFAASASALGRYLAEHYPVQAKWTADYLMAILPVDWSGLGPVAYVKNFELDLHGDASLYRRTPHAEEEGGLTQFGSLMSAGASLSVRLGNLLWVPFDTRIGIDWSCNFGPSYETFHAAGVPLRRHHFGLLFSIDY